VLSKLISNQTLVFTIGAATPAVMNIIFLPIYSLFLSPEEFGIFAFSMSVQSILIIASTFSLNTFVLRSYFEKKNQGRSKEIFGTVFLFLTFFNIVFCSFLFFTFPIVIPFLTETIPYKPFFLVLLIALFFEYIFILPMVIFRVKRKAIQYVVFNLTRQLLTFLIAIVSITQFETGILGRFLAILASNIIFSTYAIKVILEHSSLKLNWNLLKEGIIFSTPILPAAIISGLYLSIDKIMLVKYIPLNELGFYTLAASLASIINFLSLGYYRAVEPNIFNRFNLPNFQSYINKINKVLLIGLFWLGFLITLFAQDIIKIFFHPDFYYAHHFIVYFVIALTITGLRTIFGCVLHAYKVTKFDLPIILVGMISYLILFLILVPSFQVQGAFAALIIGNFMSLFASIFIVSRYIKLRSFSLTILSYVVILLVLSNLLNLELGISGFNIFIIKLLIAGFLSLIVFRYFRSNPELVPE